MLSVREMENNLGRSRKVPALSSILTQLYSPRKQLVLTLTKRLLVLITSRRKGQKKSKRKSSLISS